MIFSRNNLVCTRGHTSVAVNQDLFAYAPYIIIRILRYRYLHYTRIYLSLDAIIAIYLIVVPIHLLGADGVYVFYWNDAIVPKVLISVHIEGRL